MTKGAIVFLSIFFACVLTFSASSKAETKTASVLIGDSRDMDALIDITHTKEERSFSIFGFYLHQSGIIALARKGLAQTLARSLDVDDDHPQVAEISVPLRENGTISLDVAKGYFEGASAPWNLLYVDNGFHPHSCNVNGLDVSGKTQTLEDWASYRALLDRAGLHACGAFGDPNAATSPDPDFSDPYWDFYKKIARLLGGVAIDAPPSFAVTRGPAYLKHVVQVIKWANANGLRSSLVLAVYNDGDGYRTAVQSVVEYLELEQASPTEWVIGGYEDGNNDRMPVFRLGSERDLDTLNSVALWLIKHLEARALHR